MQYDNKIINSETLKILNKNYKLSIDFLSLIPIGEESYCYLGIEESGKKFFAKYCEKLEIIKNIESINNLLLELKNLDFIVSPLEAQGRTVFPVLKGKVYVYPYIEGEVMDMPNEQFNKDLVSKLMGIMVKIHSLGSTVKKNLPREDFVNNFFEKFQQLKKTFKNSLSGEDSKQLFTEKEKIISQLIENHTNLGKKYYEAKTEFVLTHGDITGLNVILSKEGLKLIDWDGAMFAPFEKDLIFLLDNSHFPLDEYLKKMYKKTYNKELINYYGQQWSINTIMDNFEKLLSENINEKEKLESILEIEKYLGYSN